MVDLLDICKICLRTDVKLKEIDKVLSDYHYVVTDFALMHIDSRLCVECEYLLKKSYRFSQKCVKAAKVLQLWHRSIVFGTRDGIPLSILHTQVPQWHLNVYPQENIEISTHNEPDLIQQNSKLSSSSRPKLPLNGNLQESIESNDELQPANQEKCKLSSVFRTQAPQLPLNNVWPRECKGPYKHNGPQPDAIQEEISEINLDNDVKKEIELKVPEEKQENLVTVKVEDTFQEFINEDDTGDHDGTNDASLSSDDEFLAAKRLRRSQDFKSEINIKKDIKRSVTDNKEIVKCDEGNEVKNYNEVLKSAKCIIAKLKNINKNLNQIYKKWEKTSLIDLPDITVASTIRRSVTKKKLIDKGEKKAQMLKNKGVVAKLATMSADLDSIRGSCGTLFSYKEGLLNPIERLRAELTSRFALCGELKTEDGYVINKETIMNCFDRVSECLMRRLWRFMHGKSGFESRAINTLKHIQNKYQNEYQYETVFFIEYLNTKEKVQEEFEKRRTYKCYLNSKYKCETCYLGFKYEAQMENHKHSHEESAGQYPCPTCGVRHKSKRSLDTHSKSHEAVYKCKLCPLVTYYRYSMMNHYNQHEGKMYKCELCDTTFRSKSAYKTHHGLRHSAGDKICTICGRALTSQRSLTWHMAKHKRESPVVGNPVPCAPCNLSFATQQAYLRHRKTAHNSATYMKQNALEDAPKKKPIHTCRVCNAVGHSIGWLTLHFSLEHPAVDMALTYADKQQHLCEICGKGYANLYNLRDHLSIHAGVRAFSCAECGARFHRAVSLAQHRLTHQPPRRACTSCGKRFHSQSNLNNHMRGHSGDRRYKCNLCGKGFLHRNALNEHIRGVHYNMRRVRKRTDDPRKDLPNHLIK